MPRSRLRLGCGATRLHLDSVIFTRTCVSTPFDAPQPHRIACTWPQRVSVGLALCLALGCRAAPFAPQEAPPRASACAETWSLLSALEEAAQSVFDIGLHRLGGELEHPDVLDVRTSRKPTSAS